MIEISSRTLQLTFDPDRGILNLRSRKFSKASFSTRFDVICLLDGKEIHLVSQALRFRQLPNSTADDPGLGDLKFAAFETSTALTDSMIKIQLVLGLTDELGLVQMKIINDGSSPVALERLSLLDIDQGDLQLGDVQEPKPAFYSNGWQSWSPTRTYHLGDRQIRSKLGRLQKPMIINPATPQPKKRNHFSSEMFGLLGDLDSRVGLAAGFLSQKYHFGSLETRFDPAPSLKMWANGDQVVLLSGESITSDWGAFGFVHLDDPEPMTPYLQAVSRAHSLERNLPVPTGWCSWYYYYQDISEENIRSNIASLEKIRSEVPLDLCQIDDGFQAQVGDWLVFDPAFPEGVQPLAKEIKAKGMTPGLWLAPFIVHPQARLVQDHPDWLLRDERGRPVTAGFGWNRLTTFALDLTHPGALAYACEVIHKASHEWGFDYLKLDFLYAAALPGKFHDPSQSRAQVLRKGLEALRQAAGEETSMLACGCPLGSALGLFEAMRIGPDVNSTWKPHFPPVSYFLRNEAGMPSARNALKNTLTRAMMHIHWWINDPDCLMIRPDSDLTLSEVQTMASVIALTGGSLLLSDNLPALPSDRLEIVKALLPPISKRAQVLDWLDSREPSRIKLDLTGEIGSWALLAMINWQDIPASLTFNAKDFLLPAGQTYWLREFWTGEISKMSDDSPFTAHQVQAHGIRVLAVRLSLPEQPVYLGSDLHFSQGMEVADWTVKGKEITFRMDLGRKATGNVSVYLPWKPVDVWVDDQPYTLHDQGGGIYQLRLEDIDDGKILIRG